MNCESDQLANVEDKRRNRFETLNTTEALFEAIQLQQLKVAQEMIERYKETVRNREDLSDANTFKINPQLQDDNGLSLLHWAVRSKSLELVNHVLDLPDLDYNVQDNIGWTALHYAVHNSYRDIVMTIIKHSNQKEKEIGSPTSPNKKLSLLSINIKSKDGKTPLDFSKDKDISSLLKTFGAKKGSGKSFLRSSSKEKSAPMPAYRTQSFESSVTPHSDEDSSDSEFAKSVANKWLSRSHDSDNTAKWGSAPTSSHKPANRGSIIGKTRSGSGPSILGSNSKHASYNPQSSEDEHAKVSPPQQPKREYNKDLYLHGPIEKPRVVSPPMNHEIDMSTQTKRRGRTVLFETV